MRIKRTLIPGKPGTIKWVNKYGDRLVCVRYRYDPINHHKMKTVEIIVDKGVKRKRRERIPANKIMQIKVIYGEKELARVVKQAGGKWNRTEKVWELPYQAICDLGLEDRMVL